MSALIPGANCGLCISDQYDWGFSDKSGHATGFASYQGRKIAIKEIAAGLI